VRQPGGNVFDIRDEIWVPSASPKERPPESFGAERPLEASNEASRGTKDDRGSGLSLLQSFRGRPVWVVAGVVLAVGIAVANGARNRDGSLPDRAESITAPAKRAGPASRAQARGPSRSDDRRRISGSRELDTRPELVPADAHATRRLTTTPNDSRAALQSADLNLLPDEFGFER
jgi:hypothetical protein